MAIVVLEVCVMFSGGKAASVVNTTKLYLSPLAKIVYRYGPNRVYVYLFFKNGIIDDARTLILRNISFYPTSPPQKEGDVWVYLIYSTVFGQDLCPITSCNMFPQAQRDVLMPRANSSHTAKRDNAAKDNM